MSLAIVWLAATCLLQSFLEVNSAFVFRLSPMIRFHLIGLQSSSWTKLLDTTVTNTTKNESYTNTTVNHSNKSTITLEIEQKFAFDNGGSLEERLKELGLQKKDCITMVDWYFDLPAPNWVLAPQDYWLRYREKEQGGSWELKRAGRHGGGTTLYEEIKGLEGFNMALSVVPSFAQDNINRIPKTFDGFTVPELPVPSALVPFARIETRRSTWFFPETRNGSCDPFRGLSVVLDSTNFGHMVGEVEALVYDEKDISVAREKVVRYRFQRNPSVK